MKVLLFGATGMIGQGVLRECLADPGVTSVTTIGRGTTGSEHPKLREVHHEDFTDFGAVLDCFRGVDACFFCLGVSASGMSEAAYQHITYDFTLAAARALQSVNPSATFAYVSGAGTDSSEKGRWMWARVKGKTENALLGLGLDRAVMLRPGYIQPVDGITSRTRLYRVMYAISGPLFPLWRRLFPRHVLTTADLGRAMIQLARHGAPKPVLESWDLVALARAFTSAEG